MNIAAMASRRDIGPMVKKHGCDMSQNASGAIAAIIGAPIFIICTRAKDGAAVSKGPAISVSPYMQSGHDDALVVAPI